jgi:hypothetical protein
VRLFRDSFAVCCSSTRGGRHSVSSLCDSGQTA